MDDKNFELDIIGERAIEVASQINQANSEIKYTDIKGKEYAEVKERIIAFRKVYPEGAILTEIVELDEKHCVMKATVKNDIGDVLATGHASETFGSSNINRTSMLENCESSSVGRALGLVGLGIKGGVASAQEIQKAKNIEDRRNSMLVCHRCNSPILDAIGPNGETISAARISREAVKKYGDSLCLTCLMELKKINVDLGGDK